VAEGSAPPKEELEHLVSLCQGKVRIPLLGKSKDSLVREK